MVQDSETAAVEQEILDLLHSRPSGTWYCRAFVSPNGECLVRLRREDGLKLSLTVGPEVRNPRDVAHAVSAATRRLRPAWCSSLTT
jgi:hypothetical protein